MMGKIATGEIDETTTTDDGKSAAAMALGGKARAAGMSAKKRNEIAAKAADARWKKAK